jgi:transposase
MVGVDSHGDRHVACAIDQLGRRLAIAAFATTPTGDRALLDWPGRWARWRRLGWRLRLLWRRPGPLPHWSGRLVLEGNRPDRSARRGRGKSDPVDAEAAAPAVLAGQVTAIPKTGSHLVAMVRGRPVARTTAVKARSQAVTALRALVVTAPPELGEQLGELPASRLAGRAARLVSGPVLTTMAATKLALGLLGERCQALEVELARLDAELDRRTAQPAPQLGQLCGVGPETAGALLAAAGDNPGRLHSEPHSRC